MQRIAEQGVVIDEEDVRHKGSWFSTFRTSPPAGRPKKRSARARPSSGPWPNPCRRWCGWRATTGGTRTSINAGIDAHRYEGRANDIIGTVHGEAYGDVFHWSFTLALSPGNRFKNARMINHTTIRKLGFVVGQVTEQFSRKGAPRTDSVYKVEKGRLERYFGP